MGAWLAPIPDVDFGRHLARSDESTKRTSRHIQRRAASFLEFGLPSPPWMAYLGEVMKQPEIKSALIDALNVGMDSSLEARGYSRSPKGLVYSHTVDGARCQFAVEFASNPSYAPGCIAHLTPALRIGNQSVSERALRLVEDPFLLANAPEVIQNRRLTMVVEPQLPEWYVPEVEQLPSAIDQILEAFFDHGLPFLSDYSTASGIIRQHEAGDPRPLRQQHYFVYVIAAYLLEGRPEAALALLHGRFTPPGIKRKFQRLWTNMNEQVEALNPQ